MELRVEVPSDLPKVRADRLTMLQVLDNVLDNAIKYSPGGDALIVRAESRGRYVHIEISDRGPGIPVDERERVFEKFYRGRDAAVGGSGLGLAIVRRVVSDHRGRVEIRSADPHGTTVEIVLPVHH